MPLLGKAEMTEACAVPLVKGGRSLLPRLPVLSGQVQVSVGGAFPGCGYEHVLST